MKNCVHVNFFFNFQVVNKTYDVSNFPALLGSLGMLAINDKTARPFTDFYTIILEGQICGCVHKDNAQSFCEQLRYFKLQSSNQVFLFLIFIIFRYLFSLD